MAENLSAVAPLDGNQHLLVDTLLDCSADCIKIVELDGSLSYVNRPGLCLLEIDDFAALKGRPWVDAWPESSRFQVINALDVARRGSVARFSSACPTAKGQQRWWDVVVNPVFGDDQAVRHLLVVSRDVTAVRTVAVQLQASEQRFRALADNMAQLAWMATADGSIFWYNQRWYDFTGLTFEQSKGWGWQAAQHPAHIDRVVRKISEHFADGMEWEDTFPLRGADGEYRWFLSRAMPIRDETGAVGLWCGTHTDITDARNAGTRLRQMARLIELSHEAILVWDAKDGIVLWNEGCEELYGYSRAEAVGKRSHDLLRTRRSQPNDEFDDALRASGQWTGELLHFDKDGREVWVESRQELMRLGDRDVVLETNRDITDRRRADETRNILVAELDHRVKNTLAIVQAIARQTARNSKSINRFVASFSERLQALSSAHNILTERNWRGADLSALLETLLGDDRISRARFAVEGTSVLVGAQTALQLAMIGHELLANARLYGALSTPEGRVAITWRVQHGSPRRLHLTWKETGGPPVRPPSSYGFGLTLISRAANPQTVQAQIAFEPSGVVCHLVADLPSDGDAVPVYFDPTQGARLPGRKGSASQPAKSNVLIVEDEPLIALEIEDILASGNFATAGPVSTIEAALDAIGKLRIDAAVVDRNLFGNPVQDLVAELKRRNIPFAYVTGAGGAHSDTDLNDPVVMKPIKPEVLISTLDDLVRAKV